MLGKQLHFEKAIYYVKMLWEQLQNDLNQWQRRFFSSGRTWKMSEIWCEREEENKDEQTRNSGNFMKLTGNELANLKKNFEA